VAWLRVGLSPALFRTEPSAGKKKLLLQSSTSSHSVAIVNAETDFLAFPQPLKKPQAPEPIHARPPHISAKDRPGYPRLRSPLIPLIYSSFRFIVLSCRNGCHSQGRNEAQRFRALLAIRSRRCRLLFHHSRRSDTCRCVRIATTRASFSLYLLSSSVRSGLGRSFAQDLPLHLDRRQRIPVARLCKTCL
jgi:hypothetical protein